jgi:hypothetical protein
VWPRVAAVLVVLAVLGWSRAASADERWERPVTLWLHGLASPLGYIGVGIDYSPAKFVALELGTGVSFYGSQVAFVPRGRWVLTDAFAVTLGPTFSVGNLDSKDRDCSFNPDCEYSGPYRKWRPAITAGALLGIEGRAESWFSWRVYGGQGVVLNQSAMTCTGDDCDKGPPDDFFGVDTDHQTVTYLGVALGWAL